MQVVLVGKPVVRRIILLSVRPVVPCHLPVTTTTSVTTPKTAPVMIVMVSRAVVSKVSSVKTTSAPSNQTVAMASWMATKIVRTVPMMPVVAQDLSVAQMTTQWPVLPLVR